MFQKFSLKIYLSILFLIATKILVAQINYVRIWDATSPQTDPNVLMTKPLRDVKQTTQYIDGLGRPIQTVIKTTTHLR